MISGRLPYSPLEDLNDCFRNATGINDGLATTIDNVLNKHQIYYRKIIILGG